MLDFAYMHKSELQSEYARTLLLPKFKYQSLFSWIDFGMNIVESMYSNIQMVSLNTEGKVIGYFSCSYDRQSNIASSIYAVNFADKPTPEFAKDLHRFLDSLFTIHFARKLEWCVLIGNPAEKQYDKICKKYGGRIVGTFHKTFKILGGEICDAKYYELFRDDYEYFKQRIV